MYTYGIERKNISAMDAAMHHVSKCRGLLDKCKPTGSEAVEIRECFENLKKKQGPRVSKFSRDYKIVSTIIVDTDEEIKDRFISLSEAISMTDSSRSKLNKLINEGKLFKVNIEDIVVIDRQPHLSSLEARRMASTEIMSIKMRIKRDALVARLTRHHADQIVRISGRIFIPEELQYELLNENV